MIIYHHSAHIATRDIQRRADAAGAKDLHGWGRIRWVGPRRHRQHHRHGQWIIDVLHIIIIIICIITSFIHLILINDVIDLLIIL